MKLREFYNLAVRFGIDRDPRARRIIQKDLAGVKKSYRKLKSRDKALFDREAFVNPYADTRILNGPTDRQARRIMVGIDIEASEILLADRLNSVSPIDLVVGHHPEGRAWANFYEVMRLQEAVLEKLGIAKDVAHEALDKRIKEVERKVAPHNHMRAVDAARLLGIPLICVHTPADNHVAAYLQKCFDLRRPKKLADALDLLKGFPEYKDASKNGAGPKIILGKPENPAGKVFVDMTGGTEGAKEIFPRLSQAGVRTIVAMHLSEEHFAKIKDEHLNVVIAGHIASDTLGLNLLLDRIEKRQGFRFEVIECSGFRRFRRSNEATTYGTK